ncbi:alpha/beta fold hydrolase [Mycobacteroides abscessus]|uniref:Alpha/beta fold hydrolase n=1 Tax=Mycobacteroides abscessus TaxID=36809 RepID=A0ABD7HPV3_9MYCO|nr:alpha/beta fold hydrolase [Mycobacteroides abscessus]AWG62971.1 alpha/beta hydrolase [Mycobacteroides abscessus]PVA29571.1 alpha/beta hydrolase [Mycobacteroides abscessus]PVA43478.1 alpha/beta hydrolase [Mycobacteroides abscessus]PVA73570.1 alpha/beta hydrolase [Mycobacteroides abscessus]PVB12090.1 alpha/beta hydrolase [Mycobacteroides abscessus]
MTRITEFNNGRYVFAVNDTGPIDGPVVVLLHGFPESADSWSAVCAELHTRGLRTLSFDQRGYAPGARPRGRYAYRVSELARDVRALARTVGPAKIHLVGHDWGALVAWTVAARWPESIETLTTVSVPHLAAFRRSLFSSDQARRSTYMAVFQIPWLPELLARRNPNKFRASLSASGMRPAEVDRVLTDLVPTSAFTGGLNWYRAVPFATRADRARITTPTTHVWSTDDHALARRGAELCADYVDADYRLEVLDGTHWLPAQNPTELARIIEERVVGVVESRSPEEADR